MAVVEVHRGEEPHAARVALGLVDQRLDERTEEAGDVGLADQKLEGELDRVGLDLGPALGSPPVVDLARERRPQGIQRRLIRLHETGARTAVRQTLDRYLHVASCAADISRSLLGLSAESVASAIR